MILPLDRPLPRLLPQQQQQLLLLLLLLLLLVAESDWTATLLTQIWSQEQRDSNGPSQRWLASCHRAPVANEIFSLTMICSYPKCIHSMLICFLYWKHPEYSPYIEGFQRWSKSCMCNFSSTSLPLRLHGLLRLQGTRGFSTISTLHSGMFL